MEARTLKTVGIFEVSRTLNVSERTVHRLCDHGMPREGRGKYDLARVMLWFIRYQARKIAELDRRDAGPEARVREQRIRLLNHRATLAEHELARLKNEYLDAKEVDRAWDQIAAAITERVLADYKRVASSLEGESRQVIEARLEDQARETLTALATMKIVDDGGQ